MKKVLLTFAFVSSLLPLLHAQQNAGSTIRGTTWKGVFSVPNPLDCLLQFKKDTVLMLYVGIETITLNDGRTVGAQDSAALEVMTYTLRGDTVTFSKVSGGSPCDNDPGVYLAQKTSDKMKLVPVKDNCDARKYAMATDMTQVK